MTRETLRIDGGRGNDDFQIRAFGQQLTQITENEIDVQAALMRFIDDQRVVLHQHAILLDFGQQNTVRHQFDQRVVTDLIGKADFIADRVAKRGVQLIGNTVRHRTRRQTSRLGVADHAFYPAAKLHADFWDLGGFTGTGFPGNDHHLMVANGVKDIVFFLTDRQILRIADFWS